MEAGKTGSPTAPNAYPIKTTPDPYDASKVVISYRSGNFVSLSGQASTDKNGNLVGLGNFDQQVEQTFANIKLALEAAGSSIDKVTKVKIYLTNIKTFRKSSKRAAPTSNDRGLPTPLSRQVPWGCQK